MALLLKLFQYLGDLTICVPEIFDYGNFKEKLVELGSRVLLFEMCELFLLNKTITQRMSFKTFPKPVIS